MQLTRRGWMGAAAALTAAGAARASGAPRAPDPGSLGLPPRPAPDFVIVSRGKHDYGPALAALRAYALSELDELGLPGMTLGITDQDGFCATLGLGWADVAQRTPVNAGHLFQIGSISKSFIALTILALADEGRIDLSASPVSYLPDAPWPETPITIAQLLHHTTGLPDGAPIFPRTPEGRLWSGFKPGSQFSYSNTGFELLGRIIERITGMPHQHAVDHYVRGKLGLTDMAGTINQGNRDRFAVGYWPWDETAAGALPHARLEHALWDEEDTPAGSIGASSGQMAAYLRVLTRMTRGQGAPILSDASARRFTTGVIAAPDFGPGALYACGVAVAPVDGVMCLHHTGGMMSFSSSFHADPQSGVACFASVNTRLGGYRPRVTTAYAIRLLRAVRAGAHLPAPPDALKPYVLAAPQPFLGTFVGPKGGFTIAETAAGVRLTTPGGAGQVMGGGKDRLVSDHPAFARYGFDAVRENGQIIGYWWGETLYGRGRPLPTPTPDPVLAPMAGAYLNRDPWIGSADIFVRASRLVVDGGGPLTEHGGWWSADKDPGGVERLRFEATLTGKITRLNASGDDMLRVTV